MTGKTTVLADDHTIVRSALRALLEAEREFEVVAEAGDVDDAVRKVRGHKPDAIVLDLSMPGGSSLAAIPRMLEDSPETAVAILTMENEPRFAREALRSGALGFALKDAADTELVEAVRAALRGVRYRVCPGARHAIRVVFPAVHGPARVAGPTKLAPRDQTA